MRAHAQPDGDHGATGPAGRPRRSAVGYAPPEGWLGDPRRSATADGLLLALAVTTVLVCLLQTHGAVRLLLLLAAACLIPGSAVLTRLPVEDTLEAFALAIGLGLTLEAIGALAMIWTGWWHPFGWAILVGVLACAVLALDLRRNLAIVRRPLASSRRTDEAAV
jgi:hypothetical protein